MIAASNLPPIPSKRYFTIGEVIDLCGVKSHVLRYWEQEFSQLRPMKRRGNRRYYQHHEVLLIRRIRELLYEQGFTIHGARARLSQGDLQSEHQSPEANAGSSDASLSHRSEMKNDVNESASAWPAGEPLTWPAAVQDDLRSHLIALRELLDLE